MPNHPARQLSRSRARGLALTGSVLGLLIMFCHRLAASNLAAWQSVRSPGPASLDQATAALCGTLALGLSLWLFVALLLSLLTALGPGPRRSAPLWPAALE